MFLRFHLLGCLLFGKQPLLSLCCLWGLLFFSLPIIFYLGLGIWAGAVVDAMANQCDFQCDDEINRTGYMGLALSFFIGFGFKGYFLFLV
ncbi:MAG: hypothetical protein EBV08_09700, partial [Synechococcaceae bacterium WB6_1B_055]|nr:hypothetical protein [Synechococcaceae bacterium WB6_1B_055]